MHLSLPLSPLLRLWAAVSHSQPSELALQSVCFSSLGPFTPGLALPYCSGLSVTLPLPGSLTRAFRLSSCSYFSFRH